MTSELDALRIQAATDTNTLAEYRATIEQALALISRWEAWNKPYPPDSLEGTLLNATRACAAELRQVLS
jgi:hypothetical protein